MNLFVNWRKLDWIWLSFFTVLFVVSAMQSYVIGEEHAERLAVEDEQQIIYVVVTDNSEPEPEPEVSVEEYPAPLYSEEEIRMVAKMTQAEAGNQSELGRRLVIDVILNRTEHENPQFPDTIEGVLFQKNQFSPATSGGYERAEVLEENVRLVREEIERRTDADVMFFRAGRYGDYGLPMYQVGGHYFSSYE